jgi:hypothetical protein
VSLAERFLARFPALDRAHGLYHLNGHDAAPGEKLEGEARTRHSGVDLETWEAHLAGKAQLGLCPIRDDGSCWWGAIDVDEYDTDHVALEQKIREKGLPLVVVRSKSGGAHLYCFTSEAVTAATMRGKLREFAVSLGYPNVEIFPKQNKLAGPTDFGSWINLPYSGGENTVRYAIHKGKQLSPEQFLKLVEGTYSLSSEKLTSIAAPLDAEIEEDFAEGPPCLQCLVSRGKVDEQRNQFVFNLIVMLKKRYGDNYSPDLVEQYNEKYIEPPIRQNELRQIIKSHDKKTYNYKCNDEPIRSVCQRSTCIKREWGIGKGPGADPGAVESDVEFGQLYKFDTIPPSWALEVDGQRVDLTTEQLSNQRLFRLRCMEVINKAPAVLKKGVWEKLIASKLQTLEIESVPQDASTAGQIANLMESYFNDHPINPNKEALLSRKPWLNSEDNCYYFSSTEVLKYLRQQGIVIPSYELYKTFWKMGALKTGVMNIKGKTVNYWCIPAPATQTEPAEPVTEYPEEM